MVDQFQSKTGIFICIISSIIFSSPAFAVVPSGFEETAIASGLVQPTAMAFAPDGRLFVLEQAGRVRVIKNNTLLPMPFLNISVRSLGEEGLLGIAFDPNFTSNRYVYLYYTTTQRHNRLSRFRASAANPDIAEPGSETYMIPNIGDNNLDGTTEVRSANHNGGVIHFGNDGMLYVGVGEHGEPTNAPNLGTLTGKLLRLNVTNHPGSIIPADNPFVGQSGARREIFSYGLRNPYTFNVDSATGRIYINDVGGDQEEVNQAMRGANFGWPACTGGPCAVAGTTNPMYSYPKGNLGGCAITGGVFYRGSQFPSEYDGHYFFSDYCGNFIRRLRPDHTQVAWATGYSSPVDLQVGPDGSLHVLEWSSGEVTRIHYVGIGVNRAPTASATANPSNGPAPLTVNFNAGGSDPDNDSLTFAWSFGDSTSGSGAAPSHTYNQSGTYLARVNVSDGRGGSATSTASVSVGNGLPSGNIISPGILTRYIAGANISLSGTATDPEDGSLPSSAFNWTIIFHHDDHIHPFVGPLNVQSVALEIPNIGEISTNVWYRIYLTVRDSAGLSHTTTRDIHPQISNITLQTVPSGLAISLDGSPVSTGTVPSVVGMRREIGVNSPQTLNNRTYEFASWSDSGTITHFINTPVTSTSYIATFIETTDTEPPNRSNGQPTGTLPAGTSQVNITLTTSEASSCRYSITPGQPYSSMVGSLWGSITHFVDFIGLTNGTHTYYIKCIDLAGNSNANDYSINFSIDDLPTGDVTNDREINILDIQAIVEHWGKISNFPSHMDLASPGIIDLFDIMVIIRNWGRTL